LLALDEALDKLAAEDPLKANLVKLRYFVGMSLAEAAAALGLSERTAGRHWAYARAWLRRAVEGAPGKK
jgi:RNA polymerase sigma factor (sigma-70 family)